MANYPIKMLKDEENIPFVPLTSTECIKDSNNRTLEDRLQEKLGPANLHGGENISVRTENYDCYIDLDLPSNLNIINNLTTNQAGEGALDAYQGKVLKDSIPGLVNSLNSDDATKALSANQGKILNDKVNNRVNFDQVYPIGAIYMSLKPTNPHDLFGGTWERIIGHFLWATDNNPGGTGGVKNHDHTSGSLAACYDPKNSWNNACYERRTLSNGYTLSGYMSETREFNSGGGASSEGVAVRGNVSTESNMPPYFEVYMWHRTA